MIGTPFEIEVEDPSCSFPQSGIDISVRHFRQVPELPEFSVDDPDDVHMVIKLSENKTKHHVLYESSRITSHYMAFSEETSFCPYGAVGWLFGKECKHKFPKRLVISQHKVSLNQAFLLARAVGVPVSRR